jgi:MraZ protein
MLLLTGEYEGTLDEKGRVFVSNKLRSQIDCDRHGNSFYLTLGANGILCLYPEKYFQQLTLTASPSTAAPDEAVVFERMSFALTSRVEMDRQGRILITEKIRKRANLQDNLTLVGIRDHIEIWNSVDWDKYFMDHFRQFQQQTMQARQAVLQKQSKEL